MESNHLTFHPTNTNKDTFNKVRKESMLGDLFGAITCYLRSVRTAKCFCASRRQREVEQKMVEEEAAKRIEELVQKRVEEELEKRKEEIEAEVQRRVEEAKRAMERQMMEEMEWRQAKLREEEKRREVRPIQRNIGQC